MRLWLGWMAFGVAGCAEGGATEACLADFSVDAGFPPGDAATIAKVEAQCDAEATPCTVSVTPSAAECIARENGLPEGGATTWLVYHSTFETAVWNVQVVTSDRTDGFDGQVASVDAVTGRSWGCRACRPRPRGEVGQDPCHGISRSSSLSSSSSTSARCS